jgi:tRNA pseudouridine38-40 synthase
MQRWKLTIEYDGTPYAGWQRQESGIPSVQLAVEDAIEGFCQQRLTIHVAGRTDAGVHARGQVAHVDLDYGDRPLTGYDLMMALNAQLKLAGHAIAILRADPVADDFHARFSATNKLYCYRILNRAAPPVLESGRAWHVKKPLDVAAMREGARHLLGHHDFTTFRDSECQAKSPMKTLNRLDIETRSLDGCGGVDILFFVEGRSFLHHQVRNMVGTLERVGAGKWTPDDVKTALNAKDRTKGGQTAPAEGLYLMRVDY